MQEILSLKINLLCQSVLNWFTQHGITLHTQLTQTQARGLQIYARSFGRRVIQGRSFCRRAFITRKNDSSVLSQVSDSSILWSDFAFGRGVWNVVFAFFYIHILQTLSNRFQSVWAKTFIVFFILFRLARAKLFF